MTNNEYQNLISKLPENQLILVEELRAFILENYTDAIEKKKFDVPYYYLNKRFAFIWPTTIPRSGVKEDGVLLGFCNGYLIMNNTSKFRGLECKLVRFVVYNNVSQINWQEVKSWLDEAVDIDGRINS